MCHDLLKLLLSRNIRRENENMINLVCSSMAQIPKDIHTTLESIGDHLVGEIGLGLLDLWPPISSKSANGAEMTGTNLEIGSGRRKSDILQILIVQPTTKIELSLLRVSRRDL
jgi:hypothetical protein